MAGDAVLLAIDTGCRALQQAAVRYALIGGAAMPAWGRTRATADADVVLNVEIESEAGKQTVIRFTKALREAGFAHLERADRRQIGDQWILSFWFPIRERGFSIRTDLLLIDGPPGKEILDRAVGRKIDGLTVMVASCEDLILLKLAAGRPVDLADAAELLAINKDELDDAYLAGQAARKQLDQQLQQVRRQVGGNAGFPDDTSRRTP